MSDVCKILMDTGRKGSKTKIIFDGIVAEKKIPSEVTELLITGRKASSFLSIIPNSAFHYGHPQHKGITTNCI